MMTKTSLSTQKVMAIHLPTLLQRVTIIIKDRTSILTIRRDMTMDTNNNTKDIQVVMINRLILGNMINSTTTNTMGNILNHKFNHHQILQVLTLKLNLLRMLTNLNSNKWHLEAIPISHIKITGTNIINTMDHTQPLSNNRHITSSTIKAMPSLTVEFTLNKYRDNQGLRQSLTINNPINNQPNEKQTLNQGKMIDF